MTEPALSIPEPVGPVHAALASDLAVGGDAVAGVCARAEMALCQHLHDICCFCMLGHPEPPTWAGKRDAGFSNACAAIECCCWLQVGWCCPECSLILTGGPLEGTASVYCIQCGAAG